MNEIHSPAVPRGQTQSRYGQLLDEAFGQHFAGWERMSPFDPVKLVADALTGSLAAVEARQRRLLETALDAMPALFGVAPKPARLPVGLFRLRPTPRAKETVRLSDSAALRFQSNDSMMELFPTRTVEVAPLTSLQESGTGSERTLVVASRGPLAELLLHFVPGADATSVRFLDVVCRTMTVRGEETLSLRDLLFADGTERCTRYGTVTLRRRDGAPLLSGEGTVTLALHGDAAFRGQWHVNLFPFSFGRRVTELALGALAGEPWEELRLPDGLVGVPDKLVLRYPDGRRREFARLEEEVLRIRALEPERFREGFFYDGVRHRLVLPSADLWMGAWNGGIEALLPTAILTPEQGWIAEGAQPVLGDASSTIEELVALTPLVPAVPRERADAYLTRFYGLLRQLPQQANNPAPFSAEDTMQAALTAAPSLRSVEISVDEAGRRAKAYCLGATPLAAYAFRVEAGAAAQVRQVLGERLPLDWRLEVLPFEKTAVAVTVSMDLVVTSDRLAATDQERLLAEVQRCLDDILLPPPFGGLRAGETLTQAELETLLQRRLTEGTAAPLQRGELRAVRLLLRNEDGGFRDALTRASGKALLAKTTLETKVVTHG